MDTVEKSLSAAGNKVVAIREADEVNVLWAELIKFCGSKQPTIIRHILSNCPKALQQDRYTWRHDCALLSLMRGLKDHLETDMVLYADLWGMRASDNPQGTIPDSILVTSAHSDIVIE